MKKFFTFLSTSFCILFFLAFNIADAKAQSAIAGLNSAGKKVKINISSNFPVYIITGNTEKDEAKYATEKLEWVTNHKSDYDAYCSLKDAYFEIHQNELKAMSAEKQKMILNKPEIYHIIQ